MWHAVKRRKRGRVDVPVRALVKVLVKGNRVNGAIIRVLIVAPFTYFPFTLNFTSTVRVHEEHLTTSS